MDIKYIKKLIVVNKLQKVLHGIFQENNYEYCYYKEECPTATPMQYIDEILTIGRKQYWTSKQIKEIRRYYNCDIDTAILLHKFTNAYIMIYCYL